MRTRHRSVLPLLLLSASLAAGCAARDASTPREDDGPEATGATAQALATPAELGFAPADFDADGKADISIKSADGVWRIDLARNGFGAWDEEYTAYGDLRSIPVPADYDGDGRADLSVKNGIGEWHIDYARDGFGSWNASYQSYGDASSIPVPADYDGDGKTDLSVKNGLGEWHIDYARDGFGYWNASYRGYGGADAHPTPADYDGDRRADLSVRSGGGGWHIDYARNGFGAWDATYLGYGGSASLPCPADYDGDGKADLAAKDNGGFWAIDFARNGYGAWDEITPGYGPNTFRPVPADYDGDRKADISVGDGSRWYHDYSTDGRGAWEAIYETIGPVLLRAPWNDQPGASGNPTGQPIGGGAGYTKGITPTPADAIVGNLEDLERALEKAEKAVVAAITSHTPIPEQRVYVADDASIDLGDRVLRVAPGVTLASGRGRNGSLGAFLWTAYDQPGLPAVHVLPFDDFAGAGPLPPVRITGLRMQGPDPRERAPDCLSQGRVGIFAKETRERDGATGRIDRVVEVDNNELVAWPAVAVELAGIRGAYVHHNAIRYSLRSAHRFDCALDFSLHAKGYGVNVNNGYYRIEGNLFDHNRHHIASRGDAYTDYVATYNQIVNGSTSHNFDVHGGEDRGDGTHVAGRRIVIAYNTFDDGAEDAVKVRGIPVEGAWIMRNQYRTGFSQTKTGLPLSCPSDARCKFTVARNQRL